MIEFQRAKDQNNMVGIVVRQTGDHLLVALEPNALGKNGGKFWFEPRELHLIADMAAEVRREETR